MISYVFMICALNTLPPVDGTSGRVEGPGLPPFEPEVQTGMRHRADNVQHNSHNSVKTLAEIT